MLGGECSWYCSHLRPNHPPETSNRQGHLYHHIHLWRQSNIHNAEKDNFYNEIHPVVAEIPTSEILILLGDWNSNVGKSSAGYEGVYGGHGWGTRNTEDESSLEFALSCNPVIGNTCFKKRPNHLITYTLDKGRTQIDFVLFRKTFDEHVRDVKVISGKEIAKQPHLLVCDFHADILPPAKKKFIPRLRTWRPREPESSSRVPKGFHYRDGLKQC